MKRIPLSLLSLMIVLGLFATTALAQGGSQTQQNAAGTATPAATSATQGATNNNARQTRTLVRRVFRYVPVKGDKGDPGAQGIPGVGTKGDPGQQGTPGPEGRLSDGTKMALILFALMSLGALIVSLLRGFGPGYVRFFGFGPAPALPPIIIQLPALPGNSGGPTYYVSDNGKINIHNGGGDLMADDNREDNRLQPTSYSRTLMVIAPTAPKETPASASAGSAPDAAASATSSAGSSGPTASDKV